MAQGSEQSQRPFCYQSASIDISVAGATVDCIYIPRAGTLLRASYVVTEVFGTMDTGAIQIGYADADGNNDDVDYYVLGTTDAANGLLVSSTAVGTVQALTLVKTTLTAGKLITISHLTDAAQTGTVRVILEYTF